MNIKVVKLRDNAILPSRATPEAAGLDLYATQTRVVHNHQITTISTGIAVELPVDTVGLIWPRSGLAAKHGIDVLAGVIDCDYRGEIKVVLTKHDHGRYSVKEGEKIAQLIIQKCDMSSVVQVKHLGETHRGADGFGSTGW